MIKIEKCKKCGLSIRWTAKYGDICPRCSGDTLSVSELRRLETQLIVSKKESNS